MDSPQEQKPSLIKLLNDEKKTRDLEAFELTSLTDDDFINALNENPNSPLISAPFREMNIRRVRDTGETNVNGKDINSLLKLGDYSRLIDYLHSLDDKTLLSAANISPIMKVIERNPALTQRYYRILAKKGRASPRKIRSPISFLGPRERGLKPIPLSYNVDPDDSELWSDPVKITGNYDADMKTLLSLPQWKIREYFDPDMYVQDDVIEDIRSIVSSPEYIKMRSSL